MINYLKTENASITIDYSKNLINKLLENNYIDSIGIQRLFIECEASKLKDIYNEISNYNLKNTVVFIKIQNYNVCYEEDFKRINEIVYPIICCDIKSFNQIKHYDDCYYEISFNYNEVEQIIKIVSKYENILLNINYDMHNITKVNNALDQLISNVNTSILNFSNMFIDKELIYKCPYNIYLNNENSHRDYGNNIPRNIYIDNKGNAYCIKIKDKKIIIGNINDNSLKNILEDCKKHSSYQNFINYNEKLFINFLNQCPFATIDYIAYLKEVIDYYE